MNTDKGMKVRGLIGDLLKIYPDERCIADCIAPDQYGSDVFDKVSEVLKKYGIDSKSVEAEMQTLQTHFVFAKGWTSEAGECVDIEMFIASCCKFLT